MARTDMRPRSSTTSAVPQVCLYVRLMRVCVCASVCEREGERRRESQERFTRCRMHDQVVYINESILMHEWVTSSEEMSRRLSHVLCGMSHVSWGPWLVPLSFSISTPFSLGEPYLAAKIESRLVRNESRPTRNESLHIGTIHLFWVASSESRPIRNESRLVM